MIYVDTNIICLKLHFITFEGVSSLGNYLHEDKLKNPTLLCVNYKKIYFFLRRRKIHYHTRHTKKKVVIRKYIICVIQHAHTTKILHEKLVRIVFFSHFTIRVFLI